jgi:hypothetical protein
MSTHVSGKIAGDLNFIFPVITLMLVCKPWGQDICGQLNMRLNKMKGCS